MDAARLDSSERCLATAISKQLMFDEAGIVMILTKIPSIGIEYAVVPVEYDCRCCQRCGAKPENVREWSAEVRGFECGVPKHRP